MDLQTYLDQQPLPSQEENKAQDQQLPDENKDKNRKATL
jgi:hypothetical protein